MTTLISRWMTSPGILSHGCLGESVSICTMGVSGQFFVAIYTEEFAKVWECSLAKGFCATSSNELRFFSEYGVARARDQFIL